VRKRRILGSSPPELCIARETSPLLELAIAGATLAETEGIDDLILGRLLEVAPVAVSVPWGFEKFDGIARGIL
jgi:hypothetical protein